jgi:hypothetical protein
MTDQTNDKTRTVPEKGRGLTTIGIAVTCVWLVVILGCALVSWSSFKALTPNEWGDFLAGAFAPLAFFWLVLGFFQQGAELRNSGQALWLQGEELRNSVEQQRQLVEVTREQLAFESNRITVEQNRARQLAQPDLDLSLGGSMGLTGSQQGREQTFYLANHGKTCTRVFIYRDDNEIARVDQIERGRRMEFRLGIPLTFQKAILTVSYLDDHREEGMRHFLLTQNGGQLTISLQD